MCSAERLRCHQLLHEMVWLRQKPFKGLVRLSAGSPRLPLLLPLVLVLLLLLLLLRVHTTHSQDP
jgi:hypothetical protein